MRFFQELFSNMTLWACVTAWFSAQALKVLIYYLIEKKWDLRRFLGLGGMPSSHSAVVCALSTVLGMTNGFDSPVFALCIVNAFVVMTDAAGVRRAAGKQAQTINRLVEELIEGMNNFNHETLKELLGHSPFEVIIGAILGVGIGLLFTL